MTKTPQHLSNTKHRVSEVQKRLDSIEGNGREARKIHCNRSQASLLSNPKNEGLK